MPLLTLSVHVKQWRLNSDGQRMTKNENNKFAHLCCPEMVVEEDWKQHIYRNLSFTMDENKANVTMKCASHISQEKKKRKKNVLHKEGDGTIFS